MSRLLVVGDLILDVYTWGDAERISPEAPVPVIRVDREERRLGGAASVARLLRGLEVDVCLAGMVGRDPAGQETRGLVESEGIDASLVVDDPERCTTTKERLVGRAASRHPHQIVRVDRETRQPLSPEVERRLLSGVREQIARCSAVLVADYGKGVCTPSLLRSILECAKSHGVPVIVDPAQGADYGRYRGAAVIKPNRVETELAVGRKLTSVPEAIEAAAMLRERHEFPAVLVTLDRDGLVLAREGAEPLHLGTRPRAVYDITGAGDMALAMLGWCVADGRPWDETLSFINAAAGLEVERFGVSPVSWPEIRMEVSGNQHTPAAKLVTVEELGRLGASYRLVGKRVAFTNGCFDLLHVGHMQTLQQAAALGDVLVVGINSDASVRRLKGSSRPVIGERDRATLLAALGCVTHVVIFDEDTPHAVLERLRPDVLVKGGTYAAHEVVGREVVEAYGGDVRVVGCVDGLSTTKILAGLRSRGDSP